MTMTPFQVCTSGNLPAACTASSSVLVQLATHSACRRRQGAITPGLAQNVLGGISPLSRRNARLHWLERWLVGRIGSGAVEPGGPVGSPRGWGPAEYRRAVAASPLLGVAHCNVQGCCEAPMLPQTQPTSRAGPGDTRCPPLQASPSVPSPPTHPHPLHACLSAPGCSRIAPDLLQTCSRIAPGALQMQRNGRAGDVLPGDARGAPTGCARRGWPAWPEWLKYSTVNWPSRSGALHPLPSKPRSGLDSLVLFARHRSA